MNSYSSTYSTTFTQSHARHITARIATDLARLNTFYPEANLAESRINEFQEEAIEYLKADYLSSVTYGFRKGTTDYWGNSSHEWLLALKYVAQYGDLTGGSSVPGGIQPGIDIQGAHFYSFLITNRKYSLLSQVERETFESNLPIQRGSGAEPVGNWRQDRAYGQGGRHMERLITW